jgi:PTS system fructose-specific IIA component/PTS system nitrogen regulatory IIA component
MHREQLGSTGLGRGIAVPHAKHDTVERIVGIIGYVAGGVEFDSLDGEPVTKVFLVLSSPSRPGDHLRALERISLMLRTAT